MFCMWFTCVWAQVANIAGKTAALPPCLLERLKFNGAFHIGDISMGYLGARARRLQSIHLKGYDSCDTACRVQAAMDVLGHVLGHVLGLVQCCLVRASAAVLHFGLGRGLGSTIFVAGVGGGWWRRRMCVWAAACAL